MANRPLHILLVDDSEDDVFLITEAFRRHETQSEVDSLLSGDEACEYLFSCGEKERPLPDVVLLDINMPRLTGFEVLSRIRSHPATRTLPVVMLTTSDHPADIKQAYACGANSYLQKPLEYQHLCEMIGQFLHYWSDIVLLPESSASETRAAS